MPILRECQKCGYQPRDKRVKYCSQCTNKQKIVEREQTKYDIFNDAYNQ